MTAPGVWTLQACQDARRAEQADHFVGHACTWCVATTPTSSATTRRG